MEAAAVARVGEIHGLEFGAIKAISDTADFRMPPVDRFVASDGGFREARFALHIAVRPWLWGRTMALARNSARASETLCAAIQQYLEREKSANPRNSRVMDAKG